MEHGMHVVKASLGVFLPHLCVIWVLGLVLPVPRGSEEGRETQLCVHTSMFLFLLF